MCVMIDLDAMIAILIIEECNGTLLTKLEPILAPFYGWFHLLDCKFREKEPSFQLVLDFLL